MPTTLITSFIYATVASLSITIVTDNVRFIWKLRKIILLLKRDIKHMPKLAWNRFLQKYNAIVMLPTCTVFFCIPIKHTWS